MFVAVEEGEQAEEELQRKALKFLNLRAKDVGPADTGTVPLVSLTTVDDLRRVLGPDAKEVGHADRAA